MRLTGSVVVFEGVCGVGVGGCVARSRRGCAGVWGFVVGLVVLGVLVQMSTRPPYMVRDVRSEKRYWYLP